MLRRKHGDTKVYVYNTFMVRLPNAVSVRDSDTFKRVLKNELQELGPGGMPLHLGTSQGGMVDEHDLTVSVISVTEQDTSFEVKLAVFFTEIVVCCGCGDDPMPVNAACEMLCFLDKGTAEARFELI